MNKKTIKVIVTTMVEIESELPVDQAIIEFAKNGLSNFYGGTDHIKVISSKWRETQGVCYTEISKDGTHSILKPIKDDNKDRY